MKLQWKIKKKKKFLILFVILSILQSAIIMAKISPDLAIKSGHREEVIVIGEVYDQGAALLLKNSPEKPGRPPLTRFIVLKVVQVIKGDGKIKPNSLIHILWEVDPEKLHDQNIWDTEGILPFQPERGIFVIVYADTLPNNPSFYSYKTILPFFTSIFFIGPF